LANHQYLRVSTDIQEEKATQKTQIFEIANFVKKFDWQIDNTFFDSCSGTIKPQERPEFIKLLAILEPNDKIFIYDLDRLSRVPSDIVFIMTYFQRMGVQVYSKDGLIPYSTPQDELIVDLVTAVKKFERSVLIIRIKSGIHRTIQETGTWGGSNKWDEKMKKNLHHYYNILKNDDGSVNLTQLAKILAISKTTLKKYLKKENLYVPGKPFPKFNNKNV